jgi:hypothetical protein
LGSREPSAILPETMALPSSETTWAWLFRRFRPLIVVSSSPKQASLGNYAGCGPASLLFEYQMIARCNTMKTKSSTPMTIFVHQEESVPSKTM